MTIRQYYVLMPDSRRDDLESIEDYEIDPSDIQKPWTGEIVHDWSPGRMKIILSEGTPSDYLGNPLSWVILSTRLARIVESHTNDLVEFLPTTVTRNGKRISSAYVVANCLGAVDAVARGTKPKDELALNKLVLDSGRIPKDRHMFRLKTQPLLIVISPELFAAIDGKGFNGVSGYRVKMM